MRASLASRVAVLEALRPADAPGAWLRVTYQEGIAPADLQRLESEARACFLARHGAEPCGGFAFIHRVLRSPPKWLADGGADAR